jgi:hypothetical protein
MKGEVSMKRLLSLVGALVITMALVVPVLAGEPNPGQGNTNFTVMNVSATDAANVQADYVSAMTGQEGTVSASWPVTIDPRSSSGFAAADAQNLYGLPDNWTGSVVVSSDQPIVAFAQMVWTNATLPVTHGRYRTAGAYNGFTEGASTLYLPSLAQRTDLQNSIIAVQSADSPSSTETVAFTIEFYDRLGNLTHTINDTVHKGAQKTYDLANYVAQFGGNWLGAAVVKATNPTDLLAASTTMHWTGYSAAYSAVTGGGTKISLPSGTRRTTAALGWLQYTGVIVQNLDPAVDAVAKVTWYDREGNALHVFEDTIPANSAHGYNTRFVDGSDVPAGSKATLPVDLTDDWNGSVVIESIGTGTPDLVAVANLQWAPAHPSSPDSASAYTSFAAGAGEVFVPQTFRRVAADWIQFTGLIVQNVGATACTDFTVSWVDRETGLEMLSFTDTLDPNIAHGYNTRVGADIPAGNDPADLGNDYRGAVSITGAGCELVAIHNTVWPVWTDSTTYSAFGQ